MGLNLAVGWLLAVIAAGPAVRSKGRGRPGVCRVSSSKRRTWRARSILFYTPRTQPPLDVPPGRPTIASPLSTPS